MKLIEKVLYRKGRSKVKPERNESQNQPVQRFNPLPDTPLTSSSAPRSLAQR
jgi:hypothetical protein